MRKITLLLHTTLDGFVAGPNGEMDWIKIDSEIFDLVGNLTNDADTALYGRVTYEMMDSYWPDAGSQPNATKHDIEHSRWYNKVNKVVLSKTLKSNEANKLAVIAGNVLHEIEKLKSQPGGNILIIGSPGAAHSLMEHNLIDEYWLFVNPIILGKGIPAFAKIMNKVILQLVTGKVLSCGVTALQYTVVR
ncbi:MAG: dihydrofolate reductase family protein [Chitinophagaceae bacterium]